MKEAEFQVAIASMFATAVAAEYMNALQLISDKYTANKAKVAEKACIAARNALRHEITKHMTPAEKQGILEAVEIHKELIYSFFALDHDKQRRVRGLIEKIK